MKKLSFEKVSHNMVTKLDHGNMKLYRGFTLNK